MGKKIQVAFKLSEETLNTIEEYKKLNNLPNRTAALEHIVSKISNQQSDIDKICNRLVTALDDKYDALFTRLRLGTNTADRNSQVIIEILNSMLVANNQETGAYLTSTIEAEAVTKAKSEIQNKIAYYKQKKDNKK